MTVSCRKCKYLGTDRGPEATVGACFRFPPQNFKTGDNGGPVAAPPPVGLDTSWCGEFKLEPSTSKGK